MMKTDIEKEEYYKRVQDMVIAYYKLGILSIGINLIDKIDKIEKKL